MLRAASRRRRRLAIRLLPPLLTISHHVMATPPAVEVQVLAAEKGEVQRDADQRPDGARGVAQVPSADAAQETRLPAVAAEGMVAGEVTAADEAMVAAAVSAGAVGPVREMRWKS